MEWRHGNNDSVILSIADHYHSKLNNERNLGFALITNDKTMYTIASSKGIPVVSLDALNAELSKTDSLEDKGNYCAWEASYLRSLFLKCGSVSDDKQHKKQ